MSTDLLIRAPVGLLPVLIFLVILLYMDSYKLVGLRAVLRVVVASPEAMAMGASPESSLHDGPAPTSTASAAAKRSEWIDMRWSASGVGLVWWHPRNTQACVVAPFTSACGLAGPRAVGNLVSR